ncbi:MAG: chorismate mutase [Methanocorpusculum sp.]|nr:chorismate mutase [Methanocorpusculum sp.]
MPEISFILRIEELRRDISAIDAEIVSLAGKRSAIAAEIGRLKAEAGLDVVDPKREEEVKACYRKGAAEAGLSPACAEALAEVLMEEGRRVQRNE